MADFDRFVVRAEVTSSGADHVNTTECTFSIAATSEGTIPSALGLEQIPHVTDWEILEAKKQND